MSIEAILLASIPGILALIGVIAQSIINERKDRNKPRVDDSTADRTLAEAEKTTAEARLLEAQYSKEAIERREREIELLSRKVDELTRRMDDQERFSKVVMSYARMFYDGARANADHIKTKYNEEPPYVPPQKFPTGDLLKAAQ